VQVTACPSQLVGHIKWLEARSCPVKMSISRAFFE